MKFSGNHVNLVTIRKPLVQRYRKYIRSVSKIAQVHVVTGTLVPTFDLGVNVNTLVAYATILTKSVLKSRCTILDINASVYALLNNEKSFVVDFRTPISIELAWLGHNNLSSLARRMEKIVKDRLVFAANERMASLCEELDAAHVQVIPNYPTKDFTPSVKSEKWKTMKGLDPDSRVVLFTSSETLWKLKAIYGLDLLLESWKLIEQSNNAHLVILGDAPIDYMQKKMQSLNIRHLLLPNNVDSKDVANWINCADVCLACRTPGFPQHLYDDKDSNKISEYAALGKPIVATGYAPSSQYLLVDQNSEALAEGLLKGLEGNIVPPKPHFWEENEPLLLSLLEDYWFK